MTNLRKDIAAAKGKALTVESTVGDWGDPKGQRGAVRFDWRSERLGADPPASLVELSSRAERSVLATCGVPVELAEAGDGTGQREAWRRFLFGSVAPLAKIVTEELRTKLDPGLSLDFEELRASDLAARARAYKQLTEAGMDAGAAARIACFESWVGRRGQRRPISPTRGRLDPGGSDADRPRGDGPLDGRSVRDLASAGGRGVRPPLEHRGHGGRTRTAGGLW